MKDFRGADFVIISGEERALKDQSKGEDGQPEKKDDYSGPDHSSAPRLQNGWGGWGWRWGGILCWGWGSGRERGLNAAGRAGSENASYSISREKREEGELKVGTWGTSRWCDPRWGRD